MQDKFLSFLTSISHIIILLAKQFVTFFIYTFNNTRFFFGCYYMNDNINKKINKLKKILNTHNYKYYILDNP